MNRSRERCVSMKMDELPNEQLPKKSIWKQNCRKSHKSQITVFNVKTVWSEKSDAQMRRTVNCRNPRWKSKLLVRSVFVWREQLEREKSWVILGAKRTAATDDRRRRVALKHKQTSYIQCDGKWCTNAYAIVKRDVIHPHSVGHKIKCVWFSRSIKTHYESSVIKDSWIIFVNHYLN